MMCTYFLSVSELTEIINDAIDSAEGDFSQKTLERALKHVLKNQTKILKGSIIKPKTG